MDSHNKLIRDLQVDGIQKTNQILRVIDDTQQSGTRTLELLDKQYEQLQKINNKTETINHSLETSSTILGKIVHFFFPRKVTKIERLPKDFIDDDDDNDNNVINEIPKKQEIITPKKEKFIDESLEEELNQNIDEINHGVSILKNIAFAMNQSLTRDSKLLDQVNVKSEIVNSNMKKITKEITKIL